MLHTIRNGILEYNMKKNSQIVRRCNYCYNLIWEGQESCGKFCDRHCRYEFISEQSKIKAREKREKQLKEFNINNNG